MPVVPSPPIQQPIAPAYPYTVVGYDSGGSEIRKFANEQVASQIDSALASANLKPGQSTAVVVTYKEPSGVGLGKGTLRGAVMRQTEVQVPSWVPFLKSKKVEWSFVGVLSHDFSNSNTTKEAGMIFRL
jgi:hypothetical protein